MTHRYLTLAAVAVLSAGASLVAFETAGIAAAPEAAKAANVQAADDTVVAKVGDQQLTIKDIKTFLKALPPSAGTPPMEQVFPMVRDQLVTGMIISGRAEKEGFDKDPMVQERINLIKANVVRSLYLERDVEKRLTDEALKKEYSNFTKNFKPETEVSAQHILVDDEAKAKEVIAKLGKGAKFEELVKEYSKDKGPKSDGDLGFFPQGAMVPEFAKAAFAMKKGDVSKTPVKTQFGFHVIKVNDTRQTKAPSFGELKDQIKQAMQQKVVEEVIEGYHDDVKVELYGLDGKPEAKAVEAGGKK